MLKCNESNNVEFIMYTGGFPSLCMGMLLLKIDGIIVKFGSDYNYDKNVNSNYNFDESYPSFWSSGGGLDENYCSYKGEWEINIDNIPDKYKKYALEIGRIFNENVPYGCCGGCA